MRIILGELVGGLLILLDRSPDRRQLDIGIEKRERRLHREALEQLTKAEQLDDVLRRPLCHPGAPARLMLDKALLREQPQRLAHRARLIPRSAHRFSSTISSPGFNCRTGWRPDAVPGDVHEAFRPGAVPIRPTGPGHALLALSMSDLSLASGLSQSNGSAPRTAAMARTDGDAGGRLGRAVMCTGGYAVTQGR
ncbi:hypothetical protein [Gordonia sp. SL306]|uniref:hypothetical protein n=1 Tax=Gordonia sp. SL306 TaxID=2995145 RepID=UPI002271B78E|nr:hypothetical protein [Gordonia sp. SL306]WAC55967.1 hypothetical protein OVA31_01460 [Gordonia sp. SL306]